MAITEVPESDDWTSDVEEALRNRFLGLYLGFVKDRADPDKLGRIRLWVPALFPADSERSWTDWARPIGVSGFRVPDVDSNVAVFFEQGLIGHPFYMPGWVQGSSADDSAAPAAAKAVADESRVPTAGDTVGQQGAGFDVELRVPEDTAVEFPPNYPDVATLEWGAHLLEMDKTEGRARVRYRHPSGVTLLIDPVGGVTLRGAGVAIESSRDVNVKLTKGASFKVAYDKGPSMYLGPNGFHVQAHQVTINGRLHKRTSEES